jgi:hypothetical protein
VNRRKPYSKRVQQNRESKIDRESETTAGVGGERRDAQLRGNRDCASLYKERSATCRSGSTARSTISTTKRRRPTPALDQPAMNAAHLDASRIFPRSPHRNNLSFVLPWSKWHCYVFIRIAIRPRLVGINVSLCFYERLTRYPKLEMLSSTPTSRTFACSRHCFFAGAIMTTRRHTWYGRKQVGSTAGCYGHGSCPAPCVDPPTPFQGSANSHRNNSLVIYLDC